MVSSLKVLPIEAVKGFSCLGDGNLTDNKTVLLLAVSRINGGDRNNKNDSGRKLEKIIRTQTVLYRRRGTFVVLDVGEIYVYLLDNWYYHCKQITQIISFNCFCSSR